jgi:hypothetical protein
MKRVLGLLSILAFASTASAFKAGHKGHWEGGGYWRAADGTQGKWTSTSKVKMGKGSFTVKEETTIHTPDGKTQVMNEERTSTFGKNGFMTITKNGKDHGTGYCGFKQCHMEGTGWEETVTFHGGKIFRIGSHTENGHQIMWQGKMEQVKKAKKGRKHSCVDCDQCSDCCDSDKGCAVDETDCDECQH